MTPPKNYVALANPGCPQALRATNGDEKPAEAGYHPAADYQSALYTLRVARGFSKPAKAKSERSPPNS